MKLSKNFRMINIIFLAAIAITFLCIMIFRSNASIQDRLFDLMESFFHRTLDRREWQDRFNGSWAFFPLITEIKVLALIWIGRFLAGFIKSSTGNVREGNRIDVFFGSRMLAFVLGVIIVSLFAIAVYYTPVMIPDGSGRHTNLFLVIVGAALYAGFIVFLKKAIENLRLKRNTDFISIDKRSLCLFFILIIFIDLVWFLVFYPGLAMTDTKAIVLQGLSISSQHPWLYCLLVDMLVRIMSALGLGYEGVFVFMSLLQIVLSALVFTHCIYVLMKEHINKYMLYTIMSVYVLSPIYAYFSIYLVKDTLFSLVVIELVIFLYEYLKSEGKILTSRKDYIRIVLLCVGMLLRNNGKYMLIFTLLCMLLLDIYNYKKVLAIVFIIICTSTLTSTVETAGGITHNFRETVGIPIQQISAVVTNAGNISENEAEFINRILPVDKIKSSYDPYLVDRIKFNEKFDWEYLNANKKEFLKIWTGLLVKNLPVYIEAYGKATCGLWAVKKGYIERPDSLNYGFGRDFTDSYGIHVKTVLPEGMDNKLSDLMYRFTDVTPGEGQLLWIVLLLSIVFMLLNANRYFIIFAPVIGGYITLFLATPGAYSWRYIYYAALLVPFLIGLLFADYDVTVI